eukprot:10437354-Alexandrium_andersonii.AAC.1
MAVGACEAWLFTGPIAGLRGRRARPAWSGLAGVFAEFRSAAALRARESQGVFNAQMCSTGWEMQTAPSAQVRAAGPRCRRRALSLIHI